MHPQTEPVIIYQLEDIRTSFLWMCSKPQQCDTDVKEHYFDSEGWSLQTVVHFFPNVHPYFHFPDLAQFPRQRQQTINSGQSQYMEQFTGLQLYCCLASDLCKVCPSPCWPLLSTLDSGLSALYPLLSALCPLLPKCTNHIRHTRPLSSYQTN